jgi:hypothetical protein
MPVTIENKEIAVLFRAPDSVSEQKNMEVREQENEEAAEAAPAKEQSFFKQLII